MRKPFRRFLIIYALTGTLLALPFVISLIFIGNAYENSPFARIAQIQQEKNAIYGTALNQNTFGYKMELVKLKRPKVVALGSSRILELRQEFFSVPFVNCGGAMNHLNEGRMFLEQMLPRHRPELVILSLDFWWFSDELSQPAFYPYHDNDGTQVTIEKLFKPYIFLSDGRLRPGDAAKLLLFGVRRNAVTNYENLGLRAIGRSDGFRKDGSNLYAGTVFGSVPDSGRAVDFPEGRDRRRAASRRYELGDALSSRRVQELEGILRLLREARISVIVLLPPLSATAFGRLEGSPEKYGYLRRFEKYVSAMAEEGYNFHDIRRIGSEDCECIDSIHIGDVAYQRLLLTIDRVNPSSKLGPYLAKDVMRRTIEAYSGRTLSIFEHDRPFFPLKEIDFLGIGCRK